MSQSSPSRSASPYSLPVGWNSSQEVCSLQYFHQRSRQLFLVKTLVIGGELLISAMVRVIGRGERDREGGEREGGRSERGREGGEREGGRREGGRGKRGREKREREGGRDGGREGG